MSENEKMAALAEEELDTVSGGVTRNYLAAVDVMNGKYGDGAARRNNLIRAGYDPDQVQKLVNNMIWR